jgi:hypothetical protein
MATAASCTPVAHVALTNCSFRILITHVPYNIVFQRAILVGPYRPRMLIGMVGHSMGGGATILITNMWAAQPADSQIRLRGAVPLQPWNSPLAPTIKHVEIPMLLMGGLQDTTVTPTMYRAIFQQSAQLKALLEIDGGHFEPANAGGRYLAPTVNFLYASLLGDLPRWQALFPETVPSTSTPTSPSDNKRSSAAALVGVTVGVLLAVALGVGCVWKRRAANRGHEAALLLSQEA